MIRLMDKSVVIDLERWANLGLDDFAVEILAHEIGHHVLAPSTLIDHFRLLARMRRDFLRLKPMHRMIANLFTDLLINDRLQRTSGSAHGRSLSINARAFRRKGAQPDPMWMLYMGIYESLWKLAKGSLGGPVGDSETEADCLAGCPTGACICAGLDEWRGRFASLILPYLVKSELPMHLLTASLLDTVQAGQGSEPVARSTLRPMKKMAISIRSVMPPLRGAMLNLLTSKNMRPN